MSSNLVLNTAREDKKNASIQDEGIFNIIINQFI